MPYGHTHRILLDGYFRQITSFKLRNVRTSNMKDKKITSSIVGCLLLLAGGIISLLLVASLTVSASGTVSLPNGIAATINGPFSASEMGGEALVDAGGHLFEFTPTSILVDKKVVSVLDESVIKVEIDASYWTASLVINDKEVTLQ